MRWCEMTFVDVSAWGWSERVFVAYWYIQNVKIQIRGPINSISIGENVRCPFGWPKNDWRRSKEPYEIKFDRRLSDYIASRVSERDRNRLDLRLVSHYILTFLKNPKNMRTKNKKLLYAKWCRQTFPLYGFHNSVVGSHSTHWYNGFILQMTKTWAQIH